MIGLVVKVLFFRHLYSLRTRWFLCLCSIAYPLALLGVSIVGRRQSGLDSGSSETQIAVTLQPLAVVVSPDGSRERQLMAKAQEIVKMDGNTSLEVKYAKTFENTGYVPNPRTVGVQFHRTTDKILHYTMLCPEAARPSNDADSADQMLGGPTSDISRQYLQLQVAIDAAYLQTNFPDSSLRFRRYFTSSYSDSSGRLTVSELELVGIITTQTLISLGVMFIMNVMASYVIREKMSGVRELLGINGVPRWMVNISWLVAFGLLASVVACLQVILILLPTPPQLKFISPSFLTVILLVYGISAIVASNFIAELFSNQLLTTMTILIYWPISTFLPWKIDNKYFTMQGLCTFLPNVGLTMFSRVLFEFYKSETQLSFGNMFNTNTNVISAGVILIIMLANTVIFMILSLYLGLVKPGPYGRARPWYLFTREQNATIRPAGKPPTENPLIQNIDEEPVALECIELVKVFGTNTAVNNLNLKIVRNEVTVLLGHNGAGKTTLFSIMSGMFSPTSGNFYTEDYSVFKGNNITKFRSVLGYCPQENLLLNELTVQQHLLLFGMLKGLSRSEARQLSDKWTKLFGIYDLSNRTAKNLSGGTKRKVNLAIALTGNPKYVLLDEPSAGMDTESTVKMWDVLTSQKGNFTVIITTHNMEEADILGDRIAIMANGQLKCFGTSEFLKHQLDTGYRLNCAVVDKKSMSKVVKTVQKSISSSSILYMTSRSVTFGLPLKQINDIPNLLRVLESQFGETVASTLSYSTLDDVFVEVQRGEGVKIEVEELPTVSDNEIQLAICFSGQIIELFKRRLSWILSKRMITMVFLLILLPGLATYGGVRFLKDIQAPTSHNSTGKTFALISTQRDNVTDHIRTALNLSGITYDETTDVWSKLDDTKRNYLLEYQSLLFAIDTNTGTPTVYYSTQALQEYSSFLDALLGENATVITHNYTYGYNHNYAISKEKCIPSYFTMSLSVLFFLIVVCPVLLMATAYFIVFPHEERITLFKHLQLMTGLLPATYWIVNLLFDLLLFAGTILIVIIVMAATDSGLLANSGFIFPYIVVLILYGVSSILSAYIWSFFFNVATLSVLLYWLLTVMMLVTMKVAFPNRPEYAASFPWGILWEASRKLLDWAVETWACDTCQDENACNSLKTAPLFGSRLKREMILFLVVSMAYFLVLMFFDHGLWRKLKGILGVVILGPIKNRDNNVDSKVALEKQLVSDMKHGNDELPLLVCDSLGKKYCCKTAVYDVTFTAERGECFGLVGVNGAGKTTTFGMLAALVSPSKGNVIIDGKWKLRECEYKYMKNLAYCPQYEGLLKELSARSIIRLFGRLRGIPKHMLPSLVDKWVEALDMVAIAKRPCGTYSGGNKRKLSLAITMIGNPAIVLLDEPTAGVDPIVRRKVYQILTISLEQNHQTIILTSHAMSECEAICDRLTIMVDGVMKCIGPIAQLKKTFGKSCILQVRFFANTPEKEKAVVQSKIESQYAGHVTVQDKQLNHLKFIIVTEEIKIHEVFAFMLTMKSEFTEIEQFNLSETPLEQVFILFAKNKYPTQGN